MPASKTPNPLPLDVEDEQTTPKKVGRPKVIPIKSILRALPTTAERTEKTGLTNLDFSMTAEVLAVLGAINLETALGSDEVALKDRVDWTLRMPPFLTQLREGFSRKKGARMPRTTQALAEEASKRSENIKKLMESLGRTPAEAGATAAEVVLDEANEPANDEPDD
jgi:hypothetical protein